MRSKNGADCGYMCGSLASDAELKGDAVRGVATERTALLRSQLSYSEPVRKNAEFESFRTEME